MRELADCRGPCASPCWFRPPSPSLPSPSPSARSALARRRAGPSLLPVLKTAEVALAGLHVASPALAASRSSAKVFALDQAWCVITSRSTNDGSLTFHHALSEFPTMQLPNVTGGFKLFVSPLATLAPGYTTHNSLAPCMRTKYAPYPPCNCSILSAPRWL